MSEQQKKDIDNLIENAKWSMYGEEWANAKGTLMSAKRTAISVKDKGRIDIILDLLQKAETHEKVPL
jgi:hypothetical protein